MFFRFALLSFVETILKPYILPLTTLRDEFPLPHVVRGTFNFELIIRYSHLNWTECAHPVQLKFLKFHNMRRNDAQNGLDFHLNNVE